MEGKEDVFSQTLNLGRWNKTSRTDIFGMIASNTAGLCQNSHGIPIKFGTCRVVEREISFLRESEEDEQVFIDA